MAQVAHAKDDFILEPPRRTSIRGRADVVVAGGGPAGLAAAIAAARNGARVILIERYTYLGGLLNMDFSSFPGSSTLGLCFQDIGGNRIVGGITWELVQRLRERGGAVGPVKRTVISNLKGGFLASPHGEFGPKVDSHTLKTVALEMVQEAGIRLLLHTWVVDALMDGGTIRGVMIHSKSGREAILADIVVDATADADVAAAAGAPFDKVPKDQLYRMCVELILANVDTDRARKHLLDHPEQFDYMFLPAADSQIPAEFQAPIWAVVEMGQRGGVKLREDRLAITAGGPRADIMIGFRPGRGSATETLLMSRT